MATKQQQVKRPAKRAAGRTGSSRAARSRSGGTPAAVAVQDQKQQRHERRGNADSWLTVRLPRELRDQANARAGSDGLDLSFVVRELLRDYAAGGLDVVIQVKRRD